MPYVGGSVASFFDQAAQDVTTDTGRKLADRAGELIKQIAEIKTPVKTGKLKASWVKKDATSDGDAWAVSVFTEVSYAPYVENGTGLYGPKHAKYLIKPKNPGGTLRFEVNGHVVFAKYVWHPGSPGHYMMSIALNSVDALMQTGAGITDIMDAWRHEMEATADKQA